MGKHEFFDQMTASAAAWALKKTRFFQDSLESNSFSDLLGSIEITLPKINGEGIYEVDCTDGEEEYDPAFHFVSYKGNDYPTLIYHHGNNERPFHYGLASKNTFKSILMPSKGSLPANLISIRAPFHQSLSVYTAKIKRLSAFMGMLSASVNLMEALCQNFSKNQGKVILSGISLGGWAVNLHRAYYNSAYAYVPLLAGAALDDVFIGSAYQQLTSQRAKDHPEIIQEKLNFDLNFSQREEKNVFPLLGRYDQFVRYDRQSKSYEGIPVKVVDKGHVTTVMDTKELKKHIEGCLPRE